MTTRLVDAGWSQEIDNALLLDCSELRVISPFIKTGALARLLQAKPKTVFTITRFNLADFAEGVSDIASLRSLLEYGGTVRGIKNLHAKVYLFGSKRVIVTSANLTQAALNRNHEFGLVSDNPDIIAACRKYFDGLWLRGGADVMLTQLDEWSAIVNLDRVKGGRPNRTTGLGDFGADAGVVKPPPMSLPVAVTDAQQGFVKFLGVGSDRRPLLIRTIEVIKGSGCHWAVAYPASKKPRSVKEGAVIFMGLLTREPNDIIVFGRAIGIEHNPKHDTATKGDIEVRPWKEKWPHYIRVHHAEFVAGEMKNGISLNELMDVLDADSFAPTQRNLAIGNGNTEPRRAYRQQAAVELSAEGIAWLSDKLQAAFDRHGKVPEVELNELDWPE